MTDDVIQVEQAVVSFDGFVVLDHLDFSLRQGELRFLIGPNGAGKTTLMDLLSGKVRLDSGRARFLTHPGEPAARAVDINRYKKHELVRLGIGRKFQTPSVYRSLTCYENIEVALGFRTALPRLLRRASSVERDRIHSALDRVGLADRAAVVAALAVDHDDVREVADQLNARLAVLAPSAIRERREAPSPR